MDEFYLVPLATILAANAFLPAHLVLPPETTPIVDQYLTDVSVILAANPDPGAALVLADITALLATTPMTDEEVEAFYNAQTGGAEGTLGYLVRDTYENLGTLVLTSNTDDLVLPDFNTVTGWRVTVTSNTQLTGIENTGGGANTKMLYNVSLGTDNVNLQHEDSGSLPANRFALPNGQNFNLEEYRSVVLFYDTNLQRWVVFNHKR